MALFTSASAKEAARLSAIRRQAHPVKYPPLPPAPPAIAPNPRLELVEQQIDLTRIELEGELEPKDRAQLLRSLVALLDRERILKGEPLPGSRKPVQERTRVNRLAPIEPIGPADPAS